MNRNGGIEFHHLRGEPDDDNKVVETNIRSVNIRNLITKSMIIEKTVEV